MSGPALACAANSGGGGNRRSSARRVSMPPASVTASRGQVVRIVREVLCSVLRDEHEVLEPAAAEAGLVEAGLDGDHVAGHQRVAARGAHARLLVDLEPDSVPEPVDEALVEHLAGLLVQPRLVAVCLEK